MLNHHFAEFEVQRRLQELHAEAERQALRAAVQAPRRDTPQRGLLQAVRACLGVLRAQPRPSACT